MALKQSEALQLSINDLNRMKTEFLEAYQKMFSDSFTRLRRALILKLKAMKICSEKEELESQKNSSSTREFYSTTDPQNIAN